MVDFSQAGWIMNIIRDFFAALDTFIYGVLSVVYDIFFNVATANLISGDTIRNFYSRVQLILGIVIMFKVAISLFNGVINPDTMKDSKKGFSGVIKRVIIVLIMLVLMVPLDIPGADIDDISENGQASWNARMNENGILFGTLFELQSRLLSQNTITKLILGTAGSYTSASNADYHQAARQLSKIIYKCFLTINLNDEDGDPTVDEDRMCPVSQDSDLEDIYDLYFDDAGLNDSVASAVEIFAYVNVSCDDGKVQFLGLDVLGDRDYYAFSYSFLFSTVVGVFCVVIVISFTVDAAIRLFKLAILRLISPIPVISYIDPKTEQKFQNWVKIVSSTYLDLFIRIAIVNFIIFMIREFDQNGLGIATESGPLGIFSKLFIYLGLLMFAREAPKFISESLGIQNGKGLFGGIASLVGGISSARSAVRANLAADEKNGFDSNSAIGRLKTIGSGLIGGITGAADTSRAYGDAKGNRWRSALDQVNRANSVRLANGEAGGTWWGATKSQLQQDFTGDSEFDKLKRKEKELKNSQEEINRQNKQLQARSDSLGKMKTYGEDQAMKKGAKFSFTDSTTGATNYAKINEWIAAVEAAKARGDSTVWFTAKDATGATINSSMTMEQALQNLTDYKEAAGREYLQHSDAYNGGSRDRGIINLETETGYTIDSALSADAFANDFKMAKINIINEVAANNYGGTKPDGTVVDPADSLRGLEAALQSTTKDIQRAEANRRGSDGRPGGRS